MTPPPAPAPRPRRRPRYSSRWPVSLRVWISRDLDRRIREIADLGDVSLAAVARRALAAGLPSARRHYTRRHRRD